MIIEVSEDGYTIAWERGGERKTASIVQLIDALEAEPKHGRWNKVVHSNNSITHYCSECGSIFNKGCADLGEYNYCPNCGARMDGEENG